MNNRLIRISITKKMCWGLGDNHYRENIKKQDSLVFKYDNHKNCLNFLTVVHIRSNNLPMTTEPKQPTNILHIGKAFSKKLAFYAAGILSNDKCFFGYN